MNVIEYTFAPTALAANGICAAQTRVGAGDLVINGTLAAAGAVTLGEQARITIYSAADLHGITFTVYGTTRNGQVISEALIGPTAGATVTTTANFKTVTQVATSATVGTNVTVGNSNTLETAWVPLNPYVSFKGISVQLSTTANFTYEIQYAAYFKKGLADTAVLALTDGILLNKTVTAAVADFYPWPAIRVKVTAFVAGSGTLHVIEGNT